MSTPRPAPAMAEQLRAQLSRVGARINAADRRGAPHAEVYRLVCLEVRLREDLERLEQGRQDG